MQGLNRLFTLFPPLPAPFLIHKRTWQPGPAKLTILRCHLLGQLAPQLKALPRLNPFSLRFIGLSYVEQSTLGCRDTLTRGSLFAHVIMSLGHTLDSYAGFYQTLCTVILTNMWRHQKRRSASFAPAYCQCCQTVGTLLTCWP